MLNYDGVYECGCLLRVTLELNYLSEFSSQNKARPQMWYSVKYSMLNAYCIFSSMEVSRAKVCTCVSVSGVIHNTLLISAAVYLCKRTMQNKARLELADYEAVSNLLFSSLSWSPFSLRLSRSFLSFLIVTMQVSGFVLQTLRCCSNDNVLKESRSNPSLTLNVGLSLHNPGNSLA